MLNTNPGNKTYSVIAGSGSYIPTHKMLNEDFMHYDFYDADGNKLERSNEDIIRKFADITGIFERRYVTNDLVTSDIASFAAQEAIASAGINPETLDYVILAHNFGDITEGSRRSDLVPALASRVKHRLGIKNPATVCYDLPFGCAGWLQGLIQADIYIRSGEAAKILVVGADTLSRICDPHDRDSMLYADGAGAVVLEARQSDQPVGLLSHTTHTYAGDQAHVLKMGESNHTERPSDEQLFLKMKGRVLYEHALKVVPLVIKESMLKAALPVENMDMLLIHQANKKMDEAILRRLYEAYQIRDVPQNIMPLTVSWLGNSSVATLPTLYNLISKNEMPGYKFKPGGNLVFASVGAGVNVNSVVYRIPEA